VVFVLVFLGTVIAVAWFFKDRWYPALFPGPTQSVRPSLAPSLPASASKLSATNLIPVPSATPSISVSPTPEPSYDTELALGKLTKARELLEAGEVAEGLKLLDEATRLNLPPAVAQQVQQRATEGWEFMSVISDVPQSPVVSGGKSEKISLKSGGKLEGIIESEETDKITLKTLGGVTITIQKIEILKREPLSVVEFQTAQRATLAKLVESAERAGGTEWMPWWNAIRHAQTYDLYPEAWRLFTKTRGQMRGFTESVRDYNAFKLYRLALHYFGRSMNASAFRTANEILSRYPETRYAPQARELVEIILHGSVVPVAALETTPTPTTPRPSAQPSATPPPTPAPTPSTAPADGGGPLSMPKADSEALAEANELYTKGTTLIRKAFDLMDADDYPKAIDCFKEAVEVLKRARDLYEAEFGARPDRTDIGDFIEQVNKLIYLANKSRPVGV
jgi:tetratricopeptide (TPR) repeat protein